ncbi:MAG: tryptophan 2,3-dioxygenase family protein [Bacteriovoracaceae bacterium]
MSNVYYGDYLQLDTLLSSQKPKSEAHDETLFIIIHQVYELWFKQILHELDSVITVFSEPHIPEKAMGRVVSRLARIHEIQIVLNGQLKVIETMTPLDFMDFRDFLTPASGFQSIQFRLIEMKLGLKLKHRTQFAKSMFLTRLTPEHQKMLLEVEDQNSLLELLDLWLCRFPLFSNPNFTFWADYKKQVYTMLTKDALTIKNNKTLSAEEIEMQLKQLEFTKKTFESIFDIDVHNQLLAEGKRQLSHQATLAALFISLYRDEPLLSQPYRLLTSLMDIDEAFTTWRHRHAIMAHRLLGTKIGTGGSSGHEYLKMAADNNRAYLDLFNLSTFLIPRSMRPVLSEEIRKQLNFGIDNV